MVQWLCMLGLGSAVVEAAAAVPTVDAGVAPVAEADTDHDVEATTEGVPGVHGGGGSCNRREGGG